MKILGFTITKTCNSCKYWLFSKCHRYPPYPAEADTIGNYPHVGALHFCGEHTMISHAEIVERIDRIYPPERSKHTTHEVNET